MKHIKRMLAALLTAALCMGLLPAAMAAEPDTQYEKTADYVAGQVTSPGYGSIGGDWAVLGLARGGASVKAGYFDGYYQKL